MAERWETYACSMGDKTAFITLDMGLSADIDRLPLPDLLKIRVTLPATANGLPTDAAAAPLAALEEALVAAVRNIGGRYAGRITVGGYRFLHLYLDGRRKDPTAEIGRIAKQHRFEVRLLLEPDPKGTGYWEDLYPTDDDLQVISDQKTIDALKENGDTLEKVRPITHRAYFKNEQDAEHFRTWLDAETLRFESSQWLDRETLPWEVRFISESQPQLKDLNRVTVRAAREARALGGTYDGWETSVETD